MEMERQTEQWNNRKIMDKQIDKHGTMVRLDRQTDRQTWVNSLTSVQLSG